MLKHSNITEGRITNTVDRIKKLVYGAAIPLQVEAFHVGGEPIPVEQALRQTYEPFFIGQLWGLAWDTTWFRFIGQIPEEWKGCEVVALIDLGGTTSEGFTTEGLVWQDGRPLQAINVKRFDFPLTKNASGSESIFFHVEAAANTNPENVFEFSKERPTTPAFVLRKAEIACFNREAYDFWNDFRVATETMRALPENTMRRGQLLFALNAAVNLFDPDDATTIPVARKELEEVFSKRNGDTTHLISAIGHAHIDTAWLWPLRETIRKCARTFSTALAYMEEYPEYIFGCSQPQQYAWMKALYPSIFEGIKKAVARGQWEPIGSMWIEADCNLSSGESLIRQILHGKNFFLEEFGVETKDVWLPDVFGYSASMPQIMQKAGITQFMTQKISWSQFNKFPHQTFLWEGIDGTQIFTHFPPADTYNGSFSANELTHNVKNFRENDRATRSLYIYGYGDGGGGPTKEMLETARRVKDFEGLPKVELEKTSTFFEKAKADAKDLPVWVGELYLELHRGTYTTQARNKRGNRKSEFLLRDAEFLDVVSPAATGQRPTPAHAVYDVIGRESDGNHASDLNRAWKLLLLNQFHDIIPGSSINWVYRDSDRDYETIAILGRGVLDDGLQSLAAQIDTSNVPNPLIVFNTLSHPRSEVVSQPDGKPVWVEVPACGYAVVTVAPNLPEVQVRKNESGFSLENGLVRLCIGPDGLLTSVFDLRVNREVLAPGEKGNTLQLHRDLPNFWDAWDVDAFYKETVENLTAVESIEIVESHPLRGKIRVVRQFGKSRVEQDIMLRAGSARIDFETRVDWQEKHKFLKVAFPVHVHSPRATYEIQYGHTERPTHYNTSWDIARFEVCAQKWADLSEADYGVALLNDCKYGYDIYDNTMRLSLLRAPAAPDPEADLGAHKFVYSLLPHTEGFRIGRVIEEAYALNVPLIALEVESKTGSLPATQSFFSVDRPGVVIESIKRAEKENAIIVRLYEAYGTRGPVQLTVGIPCKNAVSADLMERTIGETDFRSGTIHFGVTPFEIVTFKLIC